MAREPYKFADVDIVARFLPGSIREIDILRRSLRNYNAILEKVKVMAYGDWNMAGNNKPDCDFTFY
jgi:hypothetical protein